MNNFDLLKFIIIKTVIVLLNIHQLINLKPSMKFQPKFQIIPHHISTISLHFNKSIYYH